MSRLQIFDMEGFLIEYQEGEFPFLFFSSPFRVKDARNLLRVATYQIFKDLVRVQVHNAWQFYDRWLYLLKIEMASVEDIFQLPFFTLSLVLFNLFHTLTQPQILPWQFCI